VTWCWVWITKNRLLITSASSAAVVTTLRRPCVAVVYAKQSQEPGQPGSADTKNPACAGFFYACCFSKYRGSEVVHQAGLQHAAGVFLNFFAAQVQLFVQVQAGTGANNQAVVVTAVQPQAANGEQVGVNFRQVFRNGAVDPQAADVGAVAVKVFGGGGTQFH